MYAQIVADIKQSLTDGSWRALEIEVGGRRVKNHKLSELMAFLREMEALAEIEAGNVDNADCFVAWNNGNSLR
jgi:hypothetical protein